MSWYYYFERRSVCKGIAVANIYRCVGLENREDETRIPRFEYIDRVPWITILPGLHEFQKMGSKM